MGIPLNEKHKKLQPKLSPNRRWMAYVSAESGRNEIYICPFPEMNKDRWQVTADGGDNPEWSQDSDQLFYHKGDTVMTVPIKIEQASSMEKTEIFKAINSAPIPQIRCMRADWCSSQLGFGLIGDSAIAGP
jgi:Tol biopolymer transport system component